VYVFVGIFVIACLCSSILRINLDTMDRQFWLTFWIHLMHYNLHSIKVGNPFYNHLAASEHK